jgi:predicted acylesterase/phospholipase RssA
MKKIYLSGGGINGICYIGVIKKLEEQGLLTELKSFHGVSIGALFCMCLCLGYTSLEMEEIIMSKNLHELKNLSTFLIYKSFGIDNGKSLENWIKQLITDKGFSDTITYSQLKNITNKKLITYTVELTKQEFFRCDYKITPDLPIYMGIRMSMNIPLFYTPVKWKEGLYIDGGVINNFPFMSFEKNLKDSIGFYIFIEKIKNEDNFTISKYIEMLLACGMQKDIGKLFLKNLNIISIKNDNFVNFNITRKDILELIETGYNSFRIE